MRQRLIRQRLVEGTVWSGLILRRTFTIGEGSRFYGTTKEGKYITEADASKEGDKAASGQH